MADLEPLRIIESPEGDEHWCPHCEGPLRIEQWEPYITTFEDGRTVQLYRLREVTDG